MREWKYEVAAAAANCWCWGFWAVFCCVKWLPDISDKMSASLSLTYLSVRLLFQTKSVLTSNDSFRTAVHSSNHNAKASITPGSMNPNPAWIIPQELPHKIPSQRICMTRQTHFSSQLIVAHRNNEKKQNTNIHQCAFWAILDFIRQWLYISYNEQLNSSTSGHSNKTQVL